MELIKKTMRQFPSDINALDKVLSWFEEMNRPFIPQKVWLQCQLALAEAFTNAVRHAHKNCSPDVTVEIEVTLLPQYLEIRIWDFGLPFDLEKQLKNVPETVNEKAEGGRGLRILHQIADELSYTRTDRNRNCLLLVKHY